MRRHDAATEISTRTNDACAHDDADLFSRKRKQQTGGRAGIGIPAAELACFILQRSPGHFAFLLNLSPQVLWLLDDTRPTTKREHLGLVVLDSRGREDNEETREFEKMAIHGHGTGTNRTGLNLGRAGE